MWNELVAYIVVSNTSFRRLELSVLSVIINIKSSQAFTIPKAPILTNFSWTYLYFRHKFDSPVQAVISKLTNSHDSNEGTNNSCYVEDWCNLFLHCQYLYLSFCYTYVSFCLLHDFSLIVYAIGQHPTDRACNTLIRLLLWLSYLLSNYLTCYYYLLFIL